MKRLKNTNKAKTTKNVSVIVQRKKNVKKRKKINIKKLVGIVAVSIISLGLLIVFLITTTTDIPLQIGNKFIDNIQCRKSVAAYNLMTTEAQNITKKPDFDLILKRIAPILTGSPIVISRKASKDANQNNTTKIVYEITGTNATYIMTVVLQEVDNNWQISNFENKIKE